MEAFEASRDYLAMERFGSSMRAVSNSSKERARLFSKGADHIDDGGAHTNLIYSSSVPIRGWCSGWNDRSQRRRRADVESPC